MGAFLSFDHLHIGFSAWPFFWCRYFLFFSFSDSDSGSSSGSESDGAKAFVRVRATKVCFNMMIKSDKNYCLLRAICGGEPLSVPHSCFFTFSSCGRKPWVLDQI